MHDLMLAARLFTRACRYRWKLCKPEIRAVRRHLPRGGVGIDVGAHKGGFTWWMWRAVGQSGRVIAIEPQVRVSEPTTRAFRSVGARQVTIVQAAASSAPGEAQMDMRADSTHGASLTGLAGPNVQRITVPVVSVDQLVNEHALRRVDFIKIDTEGHEHAVLVGARQTIEKYRPAMLIEIEARHHSPGELDGETDPVKQISEELRQLGYQGWFFPASGKPTPISAFDAGKHQVYGQGTYSNNFLFLPTR